jgi:hypothetical protein
MDFLITAEERLAWAPTPVQPPYFTSLDTIVEALEKLKPHALEARTLEGN